MENEQEKNTLNTPSGEVYPTHVAEAPNLGHEETGTPVLLAPVPFWHKTSFWVKLTLALIILIGGIYYTTTSGTFDSAVAEVNGLKITQAEYDESVSLIEQNATLQGINLTDIGAEEAIKTQALDVLINNALLITAAENYGISVDQSEIDEKYNELTESLGGTETLEARMAEVGLTEDSLKSNIEERILADKYVEAVTDIEDIQVSDEEISAFYNQLSATTESELPPLEGIKEDIAFQLRAQQQQEIIEATLEDLKKEADITINI